jgi:hypothetical protein
MYEIEEVELRGLNVLLSQLMSDATRWYIVGCYIPHRGMLHPTDRSNNISACQTSVALVI